jgi:transcriptional regulatory protein LevR
MTIASLLDDWSADTSKYAHCSDNVPENDIRGLLVKSFHFIAPHVNQQLALSCIEDVVNVLESEYYKRSMPQDVYTRLFMHVAAMLERIAIGKMMEIQPEHQALLQDKEEWFAYLEKLIGRVFQPYGFHIPQAEIFYFMLSLPESLKINEKIGECHD